MTWFHKMQGRICHFILWKYTLKIKIIVWTREEKKGYLHYCVMLFGDPREVQPVMSLSFGCWIFFSLRKGVFSLVLEHLHSCFPRLLMPLNEITDRQNTDGPSPWPCPCSPNGMLYELAHYANILRWPSHCPPSVLPQRAMWLSFTYLGVWMHFVLRPQPPRW